MTNSNLEETERRTWARCAIAWPSSVRTGSSFRRTMGKTLNDSATKRHALPPFPVSLLRDASALRKHIEGHLPEMRARPHEPWDLELDLEIRGSVQRMLFPPRMYGATTGPFPPEKLDELHAYVSEPADNIWVGLQSYFLENVVLVETTGITAHALHALYRWLWTIKDGPNRSSESVNSLLIREYGRLARAAAHNGDDEMAAQYSKIVLDLSSDGRATEEVLAEFGRFTNRWHELATLRENAVKKVAAVAREGIAEHWRFTSHNLYRQGLISPLTQQLRDYYATHDYEKDREKVLDRSPTNPYRRGLELAEKTEKNLGPGAMLLWGVITEWPLEEFRVRVPTYVVRRVRRDFGVAPDIRAEKLATLSQELAGKLDSPNAVMPILKTLHDHLDGAELGILTSALCQVELDREEPL